MSDDCAVGESILIYTYIILSQQRDNTMLDD